MLMTTTPIIEGKRIVKYYGIVSGETIIGANVFRDLFASIRDIAVSYTHLTLPTILRV